MDPLKVSYWQDVVGLLNKEESSMSVSTPLAATGESPLPLADFKSELPSELITQKGNLQAHILVVDDSDDGLAMYGAPGEAWLIL